MHCNQRPSLHNNGINTLINSNITGPINRSMIFNNTVVFMVRNLSKSEKLNPLPSSVGGFPLAALYSVL